jgi:hydrogenase maturation protease
MSGHLPGPTVRLIVCGNADRGDDGVALATVATLLPTLPTTILSALEVRRCQALAAEDLVDLGPGVACCIVDAVVGVEPGQLVHIPLEELTERPAFTPRSSHQLPIDLVIGLASILRGEPVTGSFVGVAGHGFGYGTPLTKVVRAAMPAFRDAIATELERLTNATAQAPRPRAGGAPHDVRAT